MKQFRANLEKITHRSKASSTVAIIRGNSPFETSSKQATDDSQFFIGSVTKHMTAYMMLATLKDKYPGVALKEILIKKLNILFPESPMLIALNKPWVSEISLLDLLTHQSGLSDYISDYQGGLAVAGFDRAVDSVKLLQSISFNQEKIYLYSNSNYLLVGRLLEELHQDTFDNIFEKLITKPAGLRFTFAPVSGNYLALKELSCFAHLAQNSGLHLGDRKYLFIDMVNAIGAGNVVSTAHDLAKWGGFLSANAAKEITELMFQNHGLDEDGDIINLGLGTSQTDHLGELIAWRGGQDSYSSFFGYAPLSNTFIIVLSNDTSDQDKDNDFNQLMQTIISWLAQPEEELSLLNIHQVQLTWAWSKKLIEQQESLIFAANYNQDHPGAQEQGYGPFAIVPYK